MLPGERKQVLKKQSLGHTQHIPDFAEMIHQTEIKNHADTQSVPSLMPNMSMPNSDGILKLVSKNASSRHDINV